MRDTGAAAAVSPTSNLFLGSGFFDYAGADRVGFQYGLASDVGGGTIQPLSYDAGCLLRGARGADQAGPVAVATSTCGGSTRQGLRAPWGSKGVVGNLLPGCEADFVVLNPQATPLLARKTALAANLDELLFSMIVLGDDRLIERTVISQAN
jgi:guanine deaminase